MSDRILKGNCIIGQSGGPTAAINATLAGVIKGAFENENIGTVYGALNGIEGMLKMNLLNMREVIKSDADLELLAGTPAAALGSCRLKLPKLNTEGSEEIYRKIFDIFEKLNIRYFFYIGGNDSMDTVAKLSVYSNSCGYEMRVMGVPKTIDNDLDGTDHTPGYGSAAKYIAVSIQEMIRDCAVYTVKAVTIIEIMGRNAGWLTAAAALPRIINGYAPDYVYLPEREFSMDKFYADIEEAFKVHPNVVIAVSEGIRDADGYIGEAGHKGTDVFGHANLSGAGKALELAVKSKFGCKVRSVELNILQRCASHIASKTDIDESLLVGEAAVKAASDGFTGQMMGFKRLSTSPYQIDIVPSPIEHIANAERKVPDEFINEAGNNVTDECLNYLKPLIMGEVQPIYHEGLPAHMVFENKSK